MCNHEAKKDGFRKTYFLKNKEELVLRFPQVEDAQELIDFLKTVDKETKFLAREPGEFSFTLEQEQSFIQGILEDDNRQMLLAEVDGRIVGNCSVGRVMNQKRYRHRAALGIAVKQEFWGLGIGKIMMEECVTWCIDNEVEQVELEVMTGNKRGINLYKKLGFETRGRIKHAIKYSDGTYADEYVMGLDLVKG